MKINKIKVTLLTAAILTSSNAFCNAFNQQHMSINELSSLEYKKNSQALNESSGNSTQNLRLKEVKNTALALGAQNGYVDHLNELKNKILKREKEMENTFDFNTLMKLAGNKVDEMYFLPPVVSIVKNLKTISDSATRIKISGKMYSVDKPGRLVTEAPNWRQYLLFDRPVKISKPVNNLLPRDSEEKDLWNNWIKEGWLAGYKQADREMTYRIRRLGEDFKGMVIYMQLVSTGLINKPMIVKSSQNVVGGGKEMRINEKVIQLAMPAELNSNANLWDALILDSRNSLRYPDEKNKK